MLVFWVSEYANEVCQESVIYFWMIIYTQEYVENQHFQSFTFIPTALITHTFIIMLFFPRINTQIWKSDMNLTKYTYSTQQYLHSKSYAIKFLSFSLQHRIFSRMGDT